MRKLLFVGLLVGTILNAPAHAEWSPDRAVTLVVPFGAGGRTDIAARVIAAIINQRNLLGQPVSVINITGANGKVALQQVEQRGEPDYSLMIGFDVSTTNIIAEMGTGDYVLWSDSRLSSASELRDVLSKSGELRVIASDTRGALIAENLGTASQSSPKIIFEQSISEAFSMISDQKVTAIIDSLPDQARRGQSNNLHPIVIFSKNRSDFLPEIPTATEVGLNFIAETRLVLSVSDRMGGDGIQKYHEVLREAF